MSAANWLVVLAGAAAIAWVNWYFFLAARSSTVAVAGREVTIGVRGGYDPARVRVKRGVPVRLVFDRQESSSCSEEVVFPDFGVRRFLPANAKTTVEINPAEAGSYDFTCGMGMLRGKLIVED
ncbi:MAG TPA: cupredoxin domain-containing protein [Longimicrobium sp.]